MRIIPRGEWGARYPNGAPGVILRLPYSETWFHHSVTRYVDAAASPIAEAAAMRELEQVGQDRFGQGISYTWLIFPSGRIYEGHSVDRRGAHTGGRNDIARAICFPGNHDIQHLTGAQQLSAAWLLQQAHGRGWARNRTANGGHRDLTATACPGGHAYAAIPGINTRAAGPPINDQEDDVTPEQDQVLNQLAHRVNAMANMLDRTAHDAPYNPNEPIELVTAVRALQADGRVLSIAAHRVNALVNMLDKTDPDAPWNPNEPIELVAAIKELQAGVSELRALLADLIGAGVVLRGTGEITVRAEAP